jgi:hypothetical protein
MKNLSKDIRPVLKLLNNKEFFPKYVPEIKTWIFKSRRLSARGNPCDFSMEEKGFIVDGLVKFALQAKKQYELEKQKIEKGVIS